MRVQGFLFQVLKRSLRTAGDTHLPLRMSLMHEYYIRPNFPLHSVCCYAELTRIFISNLFPLPAQRLSLSHTQFASNIPLALKHMLKETIRICYT